MEQDSAETFAATDVIRTMDFEAMTEKELSQAKAIIAKMRLPIDAVRTRRMKSAPHGTAIDMRNTLRRTLRFGHAGIPLSYARRRSPHPSAGRSLRHFRVHGPLFADRAAFPARAHQ